MKLPWRGRTELGSSISKLPDLTSLRDNKSPSSRTLREWSQGQWAAGSRRDRLALAGHFGSSFAPRPDMKRFCCGITLLALLATFVVAQEGVRVITCPKLPAREVFDRLNLELAWRFKIKFQTGRDGIYSIQLIPSKDGPEMVVQTLLGAVYLLDAETGEQKWRVPLEGKVLTVVGANSRAVFVARSDRLFALDRK